MTALLETRDLVAGYHGIPVTKGVSLRVEPGEVVSLLGPNGAGKTTLLLTISALLPAIEGSVEVLGVTAADGLRADQLARRGIAHVPEDRSLFPDLTVREHLKVCPGAGPETIDAALDHFPALLPLEKRKAGLLSGGEQQMLALARAFVSRPKLLIVDELSLGLAPVIVARLLPAVRRLATESGAGVLMVEQHVDLALRYADRGYVMVNGSVVMEGEASELRRRRDLLASSYLGEQELEGIDTTDQEDPS